MSNYKTRAAFNPSQSQGLADDTRAQSIEPASAQLAVFVYALPIYISLSALLGVRVCVCIYIYICIYIYL